MIWRKLALLSVLLLLLLGSAVAAPARAEPGAVLTVQGAAVNLRAAPSLSGPVLRRLQRGQLLLEYERQGPWVAVGLFPTVTKGGWVHESLVGPAPPGTQAVGNLNDRPPAADLGDSALDGPAEESLDEGEFQLDLDGAPSVAFLGSCSVRAGSGRSASRRFAGETPQSIRIDGRAVACRIEKRSVEGRLRAELRTAEGTVALAETSDMFGTIRLRSDGRASGRVSRCCRGDGDLFDDGLAVIDRRPPIVIINPGPPVFPPPTQRMTPSFSGNPVPPFSGRPIVPPFGAH